MVELLDMELYDSATLPGLYRVFHERLKCQIRNCVIVRRAHFIPGVSKHGGTARHELVSTRIYGYLEKLNAQIAGLNTDRITNVYGVPYVHNQKWCCVCLCEYSNSRVS